MKYDWGFSSCFHECGECSWGCSGIPGDGSGIRGDGSGGCVHFSMMDNSSDAPKYSDAQLAKVVGSGVTKNLSSHLIVVKDNNLGGRCIIWYVYGTKIGCPIFLTTQCYVKIPRVVVFQNK